VEREGRNVLLDESGARHMCGEAKAAFAQKRAQTGGGGGGSSGPMKVATCKYCSMENLYWLKRPNGSAVLAMFGKNANGQEGYLFHTCKKDAPKPQAPPPQTPPPSQQEEIAF